MTNHRGKLIFDNMQITSN